ncbi:MAG: hypothetical protein N3B10_14360 [Armatimonadetes bacterium]|nr:hypothetical protein [Armatimonadota bacterium]
MAFERGFHPDIMDSERERTIVAIDKEGKIAWLAVLKVRCLCGKILGG